jgi:hypothetical protein
MRGMIDLLLMVALTMVVTNPDQELHRKAVSELAREAHADSGVFARLTDGILGRADAAPLLYNNYYLFSTTSRNGTTRSVGAFCHVWKVRQLSPSPEALSRG